MTPISSSYGTAPQYLSAVPVHSCSSSASKHSNRPLMFINRICLIGTHSHVHLKHLQAQFGPLMIPRCICPKPTDLTRFWLSSSSGNSLINPMYLSAKLLSQQSCCVPRQPLSAVRALPVATAIPNSNQLVPSPTTLLVVTEISFPSIVSTTNCYPS